MRKLLFLGIIMVMLNTMYAQCSLGIQYPFTYDSSTLTISNRTQMICCLWGNEYMTISNIVAGNTYTFDSCGAPNNTVLTLFDPNNNIVASNENNCTGGGALISSFTAVVNGDYKIQVNTPGCGAVSTNTPVAVTLESTLNLPSINNELVIVYPNPSVESFRVKNVDHINKIRIFDLQGKLIKTFLEHTSEFYIDDLALGLYFVDINASQGSVIKRLVKK